jgi:hypothetical protein
MPSSNGGYKGTEMYTTEFEINETPPSARTLLTKGYIQDEINSFSGNVVLAQLYFVIPFISVVKFAKSQCTCFF